MGRTASRSRVSIVVAEDSPTQAQNLRHLLERHDHDVRVAGNGREALELVRQCKPTLVISDVVMPEMDGYALCKAMKSDGTLKDIPVILLTTLSDTADVISGLECGADAFLRKPPDERQLLARIDYLLMHMELRKSRKIQAGVEIKLGGREHWVTAERQQIVDLLISTYEQAVQVNEALTKSLRELEAVNQELHERELEAQAANRAKSMFLATMSHEIRTPLIGVLGMLEVLGRSRLDAEQRRQFNIVQQSAHSLLEIIGDILDYSKIEAGKVELAPEIASVRDLASRVVATFSATAQSRGLRLTQVIDPKVAAAHVVDGVRLMQVLRNFVGNAIKFTERGSVTVTVRVLEDAPGGQRLGITVSDTGIGMTPEQLGRLFQPFTQAEAGTTRRFGGTGLGLTICRRLADMMGGTIRTESEPGRGTAMTLEALLPLGDPQGLAAAAAVVEDHPIVTRPPPTREQAQQEGSLLLLAEDHPVNREVLSGQLNLAGFFVDTAEDGARALERFGATRYGLVLTDLHMPGLDGYQLTEAIREFEAANGRARTPIIALTADVVREHVELCLASGMDDYLSKPVTLRQLVEKLRRWLPQVRWERDRDVPAARVKVP